MTVTRKKMEVRFPEFAAIIIEAISKKSIKQNWIATRLKRSATLIEDWRYGLKRPKPVDLAHLCYLLDLDPIPLSRTLKYSTRQREILQRMGYFELSCRSDFEHFINVADEARLNGELALSFNLYTTLVEHIEDILRRGARLGKQYSREDLISALEKVTVGRSLSGRHLYDKDHIDLIMNPDVERLRKLADDMMPENNLETEMKAEFLDAERLYVHQYLSHANKKYFDVIAYTRDAGAKLNSQRNIILNNAAAILKGANIQSDFEREWKKADSMFNEKGTRDHQDIPLLWEGMAKARTMLGKSDGLLMLDNLDKWCSDKKGVVISNKFWSVMRKRTRLIALSTLPETREDKSSIRSLADELLNITRTHDFVRLTYQIEATLRAGEYVFF